MLFGTTREFLVHFGLKGLSDLPKPKELEELLAEGQHKAEARQLALELDELQKRAGEDEAEDEDDTATANNEDRAALSNDAPADAEDAEDEENEDGEDGDGDEEEDGDRDEEDEGTGDSAAAADAEEDGRP